jgi:hypothetical protein
MERIQVKDLLPTNEWDEILGANVNWGNSEQANRVHVVAMAKLARTIEQADRSATEFNRRVFLLSVVMVLLALAQCWPLISPFFRK